MKSSLSDVLRRVGEYFMGRSPIHEAALEIVKALQEMDIPFVIAGALAANVHGHVRTTDDVDILLRPEGFEKFKKRWLGKGWVECHPGSRSLRDTRHDVKIDVMFTGDYPGDGRPKPVAFPDPRDVAELDAEGRPVLALRSLIELKLASGMTAPHRLRDLDDVIQLIRARGLSREYADSIHAYVQPKFLELWDAAQVEDEY